MAVAATKSYQGQTAKGKLNGRVGGVERCYLNGKAKKERLNEADGKQSGTKSNRGDRITPCKIRHGSQKGGKRHTK